MTEAMLLVMILSMPPIAVAITIAATAGFLGSQILAFTLKLFNDFPRLT